MMSESDKQAPKSGRVAPAAHGALPPSVLSRPLRLDDEVATVADVIEEWRAADAATNLRNDGSDECKREVERANGLERKIMSMPAARIFDVIAKLEVLDRWLHIQHISGEPWDDCRDLALLGSIRADLRALAKRR